MVGPSLGGWISQQFGWQAIFFINIPIGIIGLIFCLRFIPRDSHTSRTEQFDWLGAGVFMVGLVSLLIALNRGQSWGWGSLLTLGLIGFALLVLIGFVILERRSASPMLDLSLFKHKTFSLSTLSALLNYVSVYGIIFLMPFYLIEGRGFPPAKAGLILTAQSLVMAIIAPISGWLSDRVNPRWLTTAGMATLTLGLWQLSRLNAASAIPAILLALATAGLGTGLFGSPNNNVLLGAAPRNRQGIASGILATARNVGMVLGVGMVGAIYTTLLMRGGTAAQAANLFSGIHWSFLASALVALLGTAASFPRSKETSTA